MQKGRGGPVASDRPALFFLKACIHLCVLARLNSQAYNSNQFGLVVRTSAARCLSRAVKLLTAVWPA